MDNVDNPRLLPGARVLAFDSRLFVDDVQTPLAVTMRPATVVARYGKPLPWIRSAQRTWVYPDVCDLEFDHRPDDISYGHFTNTVQELVNDRDLAKVTAA